MRGAGRSHLTSTEVTLTRVWSSVVKASPSRHRVNRTQWALPRAIRRPRLPLLGSVGGPRRPTGVQHRRRSIEGSPPDARLRPARSGVAPASTDEDDYAVEINEGVRLEGDHRAEQDRGLQGVRVKKEHRCRDVGSVREAHGDDLGAIEIVLGRGRVDEPASSWVRALRSSTSSTPPARRRKNRGIPFSSTLPRGLRRWAFGSSARPSGMRSFSSAPVPCRSRSVRAPEPSSKR